MGVIVKRTSPFTGEDTMMVLPTTHEKLDEWRDFGRYPGGPLIQAFFPELDAGQREFLLTGITPTEWEKIFAGEDDQ